MIKSSHNQSPNTSAEPVQPAPTPTTLPAQPNLENLKNRAKQLLKAYQSGEAQAMARVQQHNPAISGIVTTPAKTTPPPIKLAEAQFIIAREYGFPSWPRLKAYIERVTETARPVQRVLGTELSYFQNRAHGLVAAHRDGLPGIAQQIQASNPQFAAKSSAEILRTPFAQPDAELVVAREHGFASWQQFRNHLTALTTGKTTEPFITAFEALKSGNTTDLRAVLERDPTLINASGTNGNTLLNLAGSCRQMEASKLLLESGANPNLGNRYGWTPVHQAAYSDQRELMEVLLAAGGDLTLSARGDGGTPLTVALFWGFHELADFIAEHDISPLNLRVAAGLGRLDLVQTLFNSDGTLKPEAGAHRDFYRPHPGFPDWTPAAEPQQIIDEALVYACRNGRATVLDFLLQQGANVDANPYCESPLQAAAWRGHREVLQKLVELGANVNNQSRWQGGPISSPLHAAAWTGNLPEAQFLLSAGASPYLRDSQFHGTPLGWADHGGKTEVRDYLLAYAPLDFFDAIRFGQVERVAELLESTSTLAHERLYETPSGEEPALPLYRAIDASNAEIVRLLLTHGATPNPSVAPGIKSPLEKAIAEGKDAIAALLKEQQTATKP
jgi:ankyrin repeat protein